MSIDIRKLEEALFDAWKAEGNHKVFIRDGVVDPDTWVKQEKKVLLILKEVNSPNGKEWDLREFLRGGARPRTWDVVMQWLVGLQHIEEDLSWETVRRDAEADTKRLRLRTIAAMNLKKTPGADTSDMREIADASVQSIDFLRKQIDLYNADIIITCGTHHQTWNVLGSRFVGGDWLWTKRGFRYARFKDSDSILFAAPHPEARIHEPAKYYYLIDAVREILSTH